MPPLALPAPPSEGEQPVAKFCYPAPGTVSVSVHVIPKLKLAD